MQQTIEIPQGYKKTKIGLIPVDWNMCHLSEIITKAKLGGNYENSESHSGLPLIKMSNILRGKVQIEDLQYIPAESEYNDDDLLKEGDLLFNTRNTLDLVGKVAIWRSELPRALYNSNLLRLEFDKNQVHSNYFMNYLMNSHYAISQLRGFATGTTSVAAIYSRDLNLLNVALPSLPEQQKIAEILSTWDEAIATTQKLIDELKLRNKGLAQQLLTGKKRLKGFEGEWDMVSLGEVFTEIRESNDGAENHHVMTISSTLGMITQESKFDRIIAGNSLKKYTLLQKGDFAYNKGNSKTYPMGCIYQLQKDSALVPFVYICFRPTTKVYPDFYSFWFLEHGLDRQLKKIITSGARGDGLLNVSKKDFFRLTIPFPSKDEQKTIASVLSDADNELKLYQQQLDTLKEQKKGLMQKLLTGEIRVKV